MPKYVESNDASARTLDIYNKINNAEHLRKPVTEE
jgi:hypothetical protein